MSICSQDIEQKPYSDINQWQAVTLLQICEKKKIYNTNINLVNDNVYTKFGLNLFILSQEIEQKPNSNINQGP